MGVAHCLRPALRRRKRYLDTHAGGNAILHYRSRPAREKARARFFPPLFQGGLFRMVFLFRIFPRRTVSVSGDLSPYTEKLQFAREHAAVPRHPRTTRSLLSFSRSSRGPARPSLRINIIPHLAHRRCRTHPSLLPAARGVFW